MKLEYGPIISLKSSLYSFKIFVALALFLGWQGAGSSIHAQRDIALCPEEIRVRSGDDEELVLQFRRCEEGMFMEGDEIKVVFFGCTGNNSDAEGIEYILEFDRCEEIPQNQPFPADITFAIPEGADPLRHCVEMEVHLPNGHVAYYFGERANDGSMESVYYLDECLKPCTALYLKDAWGGLIDVSFPRDVTIENEPHSMPYIDFGCVEICRMATRTFNLMPCEVPLELQDITIAEIFEMERIPDVTIHQNPLLTGMEICPDFGVELPPLGYCCVYPNPPRLSFLPQCEERGGIWFATLEEAMMNEACSGGGGMRQTAQSIIDQINAQIEALVLDGCYVTIHGIHISHAVTLPEGIEANVINGDGAFELISPDPMSFPMNVSLGSNLQFEIKFKPNYSGPFAGRVEICYENSCPCGDERDCRMDPNCCDDCPEGQVCMENPQQPGMYGCRDPRLPEPQPNGNGFICEYTTMTFDIFGYGADCLEYEGPHHPPITEPTTPPVANNAILECGDKCPPCIMTASGLQPELNYNRVFCGLFPPRVIRGVVVEGPKSENPSGCGQWCLNLVNGSSSLYISNFMPSWVLLIPGSYVNTMDCGEYDHPGFPYLFLDEKNDILYLVKSGDTPPIVVDLVLSMPYSLNCGDFEPGEPFNIIQDDEVTTYEYIACDGYNIYAKMTSGGNLPDPSEEYFAEFPHLGTYTRYSPAECDIEGPECGIWLTKECHNFRTDLFVVDEEAGLLCNKYFLHNFGSPEGSSAPGTASTIDHDCYINQVGIGCTEPGVPITHDFVIINCDNPIMTHVRTPMNQINGPSNIPFEVTCGDLFPANKTLPHDISLDYEFGMDCTIEIEEIFFVAKDPEICGLAAILPAEIPDIQSFPGNVSPYFSLASPSLPASIMKGEAIGLQIEFDPDAPGDQCAYVVICYENDCPSCNIGAFLPEGLEAEGFVNHDFPCNTGKVFVFEIEGCALDFDITDKDATLEDPCSCEDERNISSATGQVLFFHDVLKLTPGGDNENWVLNQTVSGILYDENGNPLNNYPYMPDEEVDGMYLWHVWHRANEEATVQFMREDGQTFEGEVTVCLDICTPIPTLGQWGIIILGILMMIFGTVAVKQPSMKMRFEEE